MRTITKLAVAIFIFTAFIAFILPLAMSYLVQRNYPKILQEVANSQKISIQLVEFDRGWFTSTAKLRIHDDDASFTIEQIIKNGPLVKITTADGQQHTIVALAATHTQAKALRTLINVTSIWRLDGSVRSHFSTPNIELHDKANSVKFNDVTGYTIFNKHNQQTQAKLNIKSGIYSKNINEHTSQALFKFKQLENQSSLKKQNGLWYGNQKSKIQQLTFYQPQGKVLTVFGFSGQEKLSKHFTNNVITLKYHIKQLTTPHAEFGPIYCNATISQLKTPDLLKFMDAVKQQKPAVRSVKNLHLLAQPLMNLAASGAIVRITPCTMITQTGLVNFNATLAIPKQELPISAEKVVSTLSLNLTFDAPKIWFQQITANVLQHTLKISAGTAKQLAKEYLSHWIKSHYLIPNGTEIEATIHFDKQLLINGKVPAANFLLPKKRRHKR